METLRNPTEEPSMPTLQRETESFNRLLPELLSQQGRFVLIKGDDLVATFDSYQDALADGYRRFKLEPFLVKRIAPAEQIAFFSRDMCLA